MGMARDLLTSIEDVAKLARKLQEEKDRLERILRDLTSIRIKGSGTLSADLDLQQDIAGPRTDFRNADFAGWAIRAKALEDRIAELEREPT
jgi:hypothetical protein